MPICCRHLLIDAHFDAAAAAAQMPPPRLYFDAAADTIYAMP